MALTRAALLPVSALQFAHQGRTLLAAFGACLRLYSVSDGRLLDECCVFNGQRVMGVRNGRWHDSTLLFAFGGKELAILQLHDCSVDPSPSFRGNYFSRVWPCPTRADLIWDVKMLQCDEACQHRSKNSENDDKQDDAAVSFDLAVGYAHDRVEILNFTATSPSSSSAAAAAALSTSLCHPPLSLHCTSPWPHAQCEDRSLLYSMHIHGSCRHGLMAVGGTVFSELLVWNASIQSSPPSSSNDSAATGTPNSRSSISIRHVAHRIRGHEGVIFHVHANSDASILCSVSDDRTVRTWKWQRQSSPSASNEPAGDERLLDVATILTGNVGSYHPEMEAYGHKARVWQCKVMQDTPVIVSTSEDSSCRVWHRRSGEQLARFSGQKGSLWSLAVHEGGKMIATGAGDGTIRLWSMEAALQKTNALDSNANAQTADDAAAHTQGMTLTFHVPTIVQEATPVRDSATQSDNSTLPSPSPLPTKSAKKAKPESTHRSGPSQSHSDSASSNDSSHTDTPPPAVNPAAVAASSPTRDPILFCRELLLDVDADSVCAYTITNRGHILKILVPSDGGNTATDSSSSSPLQTRSYLLYQYPHSPALVSMSLSPDKAFLAMGDQRGNLLLLSKDAASPALDPLWHQTAHATACTYSCWLPAEAASLEVDAVPHRHLLTADAVGEVKIWRVTTETTSSNSSYIRIDLLACFRLAAKARMHCTLILPLSQLHRHFTSSSPSHADAIGQNHAANGVIPSQPKDGCILFCGDSRGSIHLFYLPLLPPLTTSTSTSSTLAVHPLSYLRQVHDKAALTSISLHPPSSSPSSSSPVAAPMRISSTARNATVNDYELVFPVPSNSGQLEVTDTDVTLPRCNLVQKRTQKIHRLASIEQYFPPSHASAQGRDILVTGIHASDFLLWSLTQNTQVNRWFLGGSNRSWAFRRILPCCEDKNGENTAVDGMELHDDIEEHGSDDSQPHDEASYAFCYARHIDEGGRAQGGTNGEIVLHYKPPSRQTAVTSTPTSFVPSIGCSVHSRLVTSIAPCSLRPNLALAATSSEDWSIKIYSITHPSTDSPASTSQRPTTSALAHERSSIRSFHAPIHCVGAIVDHPDVVRAVCLSPEHKHDTDQTDAPSSMLLFSVGARDYLHCSRLIPHLSPTSPSTSSSSPPDSTNPPPVTISIDNLGGVGGGVFTSTGKAWLFQRQIETQRMEKQDLRIMCVTAFPVPTRWLLSASSSLSLSLNSLHMVVTGNSAAVIKFYLFDASSARFMLLAESAAHRFTLLSLTHLSTHGEDAALVMSGATDGRVMVWDVRRLVQRALMAMVEGAVPCSTTPLLPPPAPLLVHTLHQSGVDCLHALPLPPNSRGLPGFVLFSGGDDEAISILTAAIELESSSSSTSVSSSSSSSSSPSNLHCESPLKLSHVWSTTLPSCHSSAIKSLDVAGDYLYTVGLDQRVRRWKWQLVDQEQESALEKDGSTGTDCQVSLSCEGEYFVDISDVSSLRLLPPSSVFGHADRHLLHTRAPLLLLAGQGFQCMQLMSRA